MKNFSQLVNEERKNYDSASLLQSEITSYVSKVNKILPKSIQDLITMTEKYGLLSSVDIDAIRFANKSQLPALAERFHIPEDKLGIIYSLLKQSSRSIRLLPQYQTSIERSAIEAGKLALDDLTIDLDSQSGRNAAAKMYTPLVFKIVNQYVGKSRLDRPSLISAGMEGLMKAMTDWGKNTRDNGKKTTFRTYASYRVQQAILDEINTVGHTMSGGNWYNTKKYGHAAFDAVSIDGMGQDDEFKSDRLMDLSVDPTDPEKSVEAEEQNWKDAFKILNDKFATRDMDIFYRYFGLGPYHGHRQKSKDIAKEYGMSEGNIRNSIINKILKFLQTNPQAIKIMSSLRDMYTESLLMELVYMEKDQIREALYNDSTYIMLEEVTRWNNKQILERTINTACDKMDIADVKCIYDCLTKGLDHFNSILHSHKKVIQWFLSEVYPTENMLRKTDSELASFMSELIDAGHMLKIKW